MLCGPWLARRLEAAEAANDVDCTGGQEGTAVQAIAGGWAIFAGAASPLTRAIGIGLNGPAGDADLRALEEFFHSRGASTRIDLCPLASPDLVESLGRHGFGPAEFNNVLVRSLEGLQPFPDDARVELARDGDLWARTVGMGFFESPQLTDAEMEIGRAVFRAAGKECYLAFSEAADPAAGASLSIHEGTAVFFGDSTVRPYRNRGLQAALIRKRLTAALARGCGLATAVTAPGCASQRNYERHGFQVAYTKVLLVETHPAPTRQD
jgi:hypothetical protein